MTMVLMKGKWFFTKDASNDAAVPYSELAEIGEQFYKLGKRYGLLMEFRENGIPC